MKKFLTIIATLSVCLINCGGTGYQIGNFYYYDDDSGESYTSYSIGDFDYIDGSDGYSGVGYRIGDFYYYND